MVNSGRINDKVMSGAFQSGMERLLPFEGIQNFRDLGGYETSDGRHTRWGMLFRSGQLSELTPRDQVGFKTLGVELICDFRWEGEQQQAPTRILDIAEIQILNLSVLTGSLRSFLQKIGVPEPGPEHLMMVMKEIYRNFVREHAAAYASMFRHMMNTRKGITLIHCTAGKDRTGFGSAMILAALGVEKKTIMEDYLLSSHYFSADAAMAALTRQNDGTRKYAFDLNAMRPVYEVHPEYLETAFDEIEQQYDSVDRFLEQQLGITADLRRRLQDKYLE